MNKKTFCSFHKVEESMAVNWVLHSSVEEAKYWHKHLTDDEIEFCLKEEERATVRRMLEVEKRKRVRAV